MGLWHPDLQLSCPVLQLACPDLQLACPVLQLAHCCAGTWAVGSEISEIRNPKPGLLPACDVFGQVVFFLLILAASSLT